MSDPVFPTENEDGNTMHHRVARLSITVDDNSYQEKQKFLGSLQSLSSDEVNETGNVQLETKARTTRSTNFDQEDSEPKKHLEENVNNDLSTDALGKLGTSQLNDSAVDDATDIVDNALLKGRSKRRRRRSSVAQPVVLRKKKFLQDEPSLTILSDRPKKATISSIRDLLLHSLTDMQLVPRWCVLNNRRSVDKFVVVFLRGLTNTEFGMSDLRNVNDPQLISKFPLNENLPHFGQYFKEVIPMAAPGSNKCIYSTYSSLVSYTLSNKQKAAIKKENENRKIVLPDLYLTLDELIFNNYPIHEEVKGASKELIDKTADYKSTKPFNHEGSKTFALDCEMCMSLKGRVLTRVSITDFDNNVLYDELVKPTEPIIDYVTQYSGITEEMLINVETTVENVQEKILELISSNDTLIGHSLESDLHILKVKHPKIVDTSVCFDHPRGPPSKASLKMLMSTHLDTAIQKSFKGHDSVEDCISCMELVKLKISQGYLFGKSYNMESLFKRIAQCNKLVKTTNGEKIPKKSVVIGYSAIKNFGHHEYQVQCTSDDEIVEKFIETQSENDLIILKLKELEWFKGFSENNLATTVKLPETIDEMYRKVDARLQKIYENMTPNSILLVCSENGDTRELLKLQELSKSYKFTTEKTADNINVHVVDDSWKADSDARMNTALEEARNALFLCTLKPKKNDNSV
ncbi:hypothetical protein CANINC_004863 [Pichia inconspicua]|uniref:Exonuclease domain-containing protein n=1 Tax=Pichia inconspicua TaxID=52247 RepID=A0A4T0WUX0_9ASCO|nr:hypothetical protein CANINC_004863 [[Candida] inconspicua]